VELTVSSAMQARLSDYTKYHHSLGNEACHYIGIPSIVIGFGTLFGAVPIASLGAFTLTLAEVVAAGVVAFYLISARVLGLITSLILLGLVGVGRVLPLYAGLALFVLGWAAQFVGHLVYEKNSPAFLRNLLHLLVGPAWLVYRALARLSPSSSHP
jgi:uncharacterized membrane protein YGL010W